MKKTMKKPILSEEFRRMQKIAGIITEEDIDLELMPNGNIKFGATVTLDESLDENISGNSSSLPIKETLNMLSDLFGKITDIDIYRLSQPEQQALADLITMCETFTNEYLEDVRNLVDNPIQEESILNEYEHSYEEVNGKCRRYNDEGEYTIVSMNYCR